MQTFFIKPAVKGLKVKDPVTRKPLAEEGERKPRNTYWLRRQQDGDIVEAQEPAPPAASKKAPAGGEQ